ncbi:hypothetical protein BST61_g10831 [Cercospora zeina]
MDDHEDFAIDPAIAAAMGFAGFGSQNKQKRKFHHSDEDDENDEFVDPGVWAKKTGANGVPVRERGAVRSAVGEEMEGKGKLVEEREAREGKKGFENVAKSSNADAVGLYDPKTQQSPSWEVLRRGGFVEDPWMRLWEER